MAASFGATLNKTVVVAAHNSILQVRVMDWVIWVSIIECCWIWDSLRCCSFRSLSSSRLPSSRGDFRRFWSRWWNHLDASSEVDWESETRLMILTLHCHIFTIGCIAYFANTTKSTTFALKAEHCLKATAPTNTIHTVIFKLWAKKHTTKSN